MCVRVFRFCLIAFHSRHLSTFEDNRNTPSTPSEEEIKCPVGVRATVGACVRVCMCLRLFSKCVSSRCMVLVFCVAGPNISFHRFYVTQYIRALTLSDVDGDDDGAGAGDMRKAQAAQLGRQMLVVSF